MKKINLKSGLLALVLAASLLGSAGIARAQQSFDVQKAIAAGDHQALANYYKSQAEAERNVAAMHDKMKTSYRDTHVHYKGSENVLAGHCGNLKLKALESAEQYDALAAQEEKLAGGKK